MTKWRPVAWATAKHRKSSDSCVVTDAVISGLYKYDTFIAFVIRSMWKKHKTKKNKNFVLYLSVLVLFLVLHFVVLV